MDYLLHQASFVTGNGCYDRHRLVRLVICFDLAIDQIAPSGLGSSKGFTIPRSYLEKIFDANIGNRMAALSNLFYRFNFKRFGITFTAHGLLSLSHLK